MGRRDGLPLWLSGSASGATALQRADLVPKIGTSGTYDEAWLQKLLHENPGVLPIEQIEPGFGTIVPACRELPLVFGAGRSGALDNVFVTPGGGLVLVEAKLWRNPDARRSVVAQAMEYAAAVFRLTYEQFQAAVLRARVSETKPSASLYEIVAKASSDVDEAEFIDAVSRNLKRGRALILVVGDGIRDDIVPLAELLQSHAGHRFIFALVELGVFQTPIPDVRVVLPSILAQTTLIERGVVHIEDSLRGSQIAIKESAMVASGASRERSIGIGEDEFYEFLDAKTPGAAVLLKSFLAKADALGIRANRQGGLNIKHDAPSGNDLNLGTISKEGFVDTGPASWWGRVVPARRYNESLAGLIGGFVKELRNGEQCVLRTAQEKTPRLIDLLPQHEDAWLAAIERYIDDMFETAKET